MTKKVLIAEDRPDSRQLLEDILEQFADKGVKTLIARNGQEAYDIALKEKPDLILLDVMMPHLSGIEVCQKIRENPDLKDLHIVIVSARYNVEGQAAAEKIGANGSLNKPYNVSEVLTLVKSVLNL